MAKNYYDILGVTSDATSEEIKAAYRQQVKKLHPDYYGEDSEPFRTVQEAYDVLSDPRRRQAHDDKLARRRRQNRPRRPDPRSRRSQHVPVEPLVPTDSASESGRMFFRQSPQRFQTPFESLFDGLWHEVTSPGGLGAEQAEQIDVEIPLSPVEARRGGRVRVVLPVQARCPRCGGYGRIDFYECWHCAGAGRVIEEYPLWISYPAGIVDNQVARLPLDQLGFPNINLIIHFRVVSPH